MDKKCKQTFAYTKRTKKRKSEKALNEGSFDKVDTHISDVEFEGPLQENQKLFVCGV